MNQQELGELLTAYLDGELGAQEVDIAERVLRDDADARRLLDELRRTANLVGALPRQGAPATIAEEMSRHLERDELLGSPDERPLRVSGGGMLRFKPLATAAMIGIVLIGAGLTYISLNPPELGPAQELAMNEVLRSEAAPAAAFAFEDVTSFDTKLASGASTQELLQHRFANEPNYLSITVDSDAQRSEALERLTSILDRQNVVALGGEAAMGADQLQEANFRLKGRAGVNFEAVNEAQVLLRVTPDQFRNLVDELGRTAVTRDGTELQIGTEVAKGFAQSRELALAVSNRRLDEAEEGFVGGKDAFADADGDEQVVLLDQPEAVSPPAWALRLGQMFNEAVGGGAVPKSKDVAQTPATQDPVSAGEAREELTRKAAIDNRVASADVKADQAKGRGEQEVLTRGAARALSTASSAPVRANAPLELKGGGRGGRGGAGANVRVEQEKVAAQSKLTVDAAAVAKKEAVTQLEAVKIASVAPPAEDSLVGRRLKAMERRSGGEAPPTSRLAAEPPRRQFTIGQSARESAAVGLDAGRIPGTPDDGLLTIVVRLISKEKPKAVNLRLTRPASRPPARGRGGNPDRNPPKKPDAEMF